MIELATNDKRNQYIFIIETECDMNIITRIHMIFTRRRVPVLDFQSVQLNNGDKQRILMIVEDTKENVLKLHQHVARLVDVMTVNLFESVS
ncbi:MAG: hypothetical protein WA874_19135 [Chryseosolibacter sp.]